jgi:hypothetical protein
MSVNTLSTLAAMRDQEEEPKRTVADKATGQQTGQLVKYQDVLTNSIPTEILSGYTVLVGITVGTIQATAQEPTPNQLPALRWVFFVGFLLATAAAVWLAYLSKRTVGKRRRIPVTEILVATIAAAAWGLVMPANPLTIGVSPQTATIATAAISIVGAGVVGGLSALLLRPSNAKDAVAS